MPNAKDKDRRESSKLNRRQFLGQSLFATTALALGSQLSWAQDSSPIMRTIPSTGRQIPAIGLGSSATFSQVAREEDIEAVRGVMSTLHRLGGRVFDTAPGYGASEEVAGQVAQNLGIEDDLFWATKLNVARNGPADPAAAREQLETSFARVGKPTIDLVQVHNMGDPDVQLGILQEYKEAGRIQHIGITTTRESQYAELMQVMRQYPLDFIGIDYAVDNRNVEQEILPLAQEQGIAVLAYAPFGRTRLWSRVGDRPVPGYAAEFDAHTWGQFFLKFVISHPAITAATPSTSRPTNMEDNIGAMIGRLPDQAMRQRMIATVDELPMA
ncbi:oxidoreductase [Pseudohongiella nitratireducens]|uniref:Oxidoreductase n=1 Tax=Pseudohongiella nitratireducens TaxID=1768907 RepID=A0A917LT07_9GAMM|nr:aldo/keto reductase [Pseudohongiella nitratireducens]GGG55118.1 oxidoreductase [Pseudohongiella nitratireducens]